MSFDKTCEKISLRYLRYPHVLAYLVFKYSDQKQLMILARLNFHWSIGKRNEFHHFKTSKVATACCTALFTTYRAKSGANIDCSNKKMYKMS